MSDTPENKDPKKQPKKTDTKKLKQSVAPVDGIEEMVAKSTVSADKKKNRKTLIMRSIIGGVVLLFAFFVFQLFKPYKGTMAFGICKVFTEMYVQFPTTLKFNSVEEFSTSVRIWYTHTDSFGEYIMEPIQCYYKADEQYGYILDKVTIRRREIDQKIVDDFNKTLPVIFANPPDLTLPVPPEDSLKNLQINLMSRPIL